MQKHKKEGVVWVRLVNEAYSMAREFSNRDLTTKCSSKLIFVSPSHEVSDEERIEKFGLRSDGVPCLLATVMVRSKQDERRLPSVYHGFVIQYHLIVRGG